MQEGSFRMQDAATSQDVADHCAIAGFLNQLVRVGPQKVWRRQYTALGSSENGKSLCLYFFTESAGGGGMLPKLLKKTTSAPKDRGNSVEDRVFNLKFKSDLELEQGCEVRAISPADAPGNKENCFMLITSKTQIKFQASSASERERWVETLTIEFERTMELTLIEQKARMLRKGAVLSWYRPQKFGGMASVKVAVDDGGYLFVGDHEPIHLSEIETVLAGTESDELRALEDTVFHFNCFVIRLKNSTNGYFPECTSLDFEAPKQSTRDDWVSALEARLKVEGVFHNPNEPQNSLTRPIAASRGLSVAGGPPPLPPSKVGTLTSQSLLEKSLDVGQNGSQVPAEAELMAEKNRLRKFNSTMKVEPAPGTPEQGQKGRAPTISVGGDGEDEEEETEQKPTASGVGEYFKQKVKLGSDFPYSRCVSFALETALQGDRAGAVLTPDREISAAEIDDVTHYAKLELPMTQADIQKATAAKKKPRKIVFDMTEFAPSAFKELRNRWGICDLAFYKSLSQLSGDGAVGDGKSGMLFFFTRDRRYVLKTVKTNEMAVLTEKGLLRSYIKHMADNPDSLVCRFFGLYSFKMGKPARDIILVCMQNSFDTRLVLHEKYDLKGSTRSRWCTPRFGSVLKDLNFGNSKLYLDAKDRADFLKQCEKDTALFEQFNVMDYSLLLGIHKPSENPEKVNRNLLLLSMASQLEQHASNPISWQRNRLSSVASSGSTPGGSKIIAPHPKPTRWQRDFGGLEGRIPETNAPQVYIMQIIDILQAYDVGKKAENFLKSQITEEVNEISSVNPKTYRARFLAYMAKITVGVDGQNASIQAARRDLRLKIFSNADQMGGDVNGSRGQRPVARSILPAVEEEKASDTVTPMVAMTPVKQQPPPIPAKRPSIPPVPIRSAASSTSAPPSDREGSSAETPSRAVPPPVPTRTSPSSSAKDSDARRRQSSVAQGIREEEDMMDLKDEPDLKAEIAAAIAQAEQEKLNAAAAGEDLGGAYTEVLEDGTEIVILEDGRFIQRMPDGIVMLKFPDGSIRQTNPDGSTIDVSPDGNMTCHLPDGTEIVHVNQSEDTVVDIQRNPDGSTIETLKDGSTVQKNGDGSRIEIAVNGDKRTIFPDGTIIEQLTGGAVRQFNPDGLTIVSLVDGTRVQTDSKMPHIVLTIYTDGSSLQEDKSEGIIIRTDKDGVENHEFPDGSRIRIDPNGHQVQTSTDGTIIETFPDGRKIQKNPDGTVLDL